MISSGLSLADLPHWIPAVLVGIASFAINLPLGYLREGTRKFSLMWFVYIHLPVPLVAYLRRSENITAWAIPSFIVCALLGQFAGGIIRRRRAVRA